LPCGEGARRKARSNKRGQQDKEDGSAIFAAIQNLHATESEKKRGGIHAIKGTTNRLDPQKTQAACSGNRKT